MRLKLLLFSLLMSCGILNAQDTIRSLIISEVRIDRADHNYIELTNMGTDPVNLSQFKLGMIGAWTQHYTPDAGCSLMLPDIVLEPGKSFVVAAFYEFTAEQWKKDVAKWGYSENYSDRLTKTELWDIADIQVHAAEPNGDATDSVSPNWQTMVVWNGRDCWYLECHFPVADTAGAPMDSAVVDQFGGVWDDTDGTNLDAAYDVAGVTSATARCILMRKFSVKEGNLDFANGRGAADIDESEWIPIPMLRPGTDTYEPWRALFWTVGNHGDFKADAATLTSSTLDINWADSTLTVPWGVRRDDSLIMQFDKTPGIAWHFDYFHDTLNVAQSHEDSSYVSVRTGDMLTVYGCGEDMSVVKFKIQVAEPTVDANIVVPKRVPGTKARYTDLMRIAYMVTDKVPGMDTITITSPVSYYYTNKPLASRVDTLFKYLEKAPEASWELVFLGGEERTDVITGDKLKVTAENGSVKEYYIKVYPYRKSRNAYLSAITWPDIPDALYFGQVYGWTGDTIPNFAVGKYDYKIQIPFDIIGIPALVGKNQDDNAKVEVDRARNLTGSVADRISTFTSTAENDTTVLVYSVEIIKEKESIDVQPWIAEPFLSEFIFQDQWANYFMEICNPGTLPLDLSNYMFAEDWSNSPAGAITQYAEATGTAWKNRFAKYIPGYKWAHDSTTWKVQPALAIQDLNVISLVYPGDVFVMGSLTGTWDIGGTTGNWPDGDWPGYTQCDVIFKNTPVSDTANVWHESVGEVCIPGWYGGNFHIFKILNDSIKLGLKPANDPNDFELIETFGTGDGTGWKVVSPSQIEQTSTVIRKPEYYLPKTGYKESFSEDPDSSEWIYMNRAYWNAHNVWWDEDILYDILDLGSHFMYEVTAYKSTITSSRYNVSPGYSLNEKIIGVKTGTSVTKFLTYIFKAEEAQTLTLKDGSTGDTLTGDNLLTEGDTLVVLSPDQAHTSKYVLDFTPLDNDALLTSDVYTITLVNDSTGTISGFEYGTSLKEVSDNVTVPELATMTIVDIADEWIPFKKLNFDTNYVDVQVSDQIYFNVVAEDKETIILYQLKPTALASDAFVTSDVFMVYQSYYLIDLIPQGTTVQALLSNLVPVTGATMKLINKLGQDRTFGTISKDDRLVVTSQDGETVTVYYLQMLPTFVGETIDYLAYVTSSVYTVNQNTLTISGTTIRENTTISAFIANLVPSAGATLTVVDALGTQHAGDVNEGDQLKVVAGNGVTEAYYSIVINTSSIDEISSSSINIYPNPSSGKITLSGLESGYRVRIYNILGAGIIDMIAYQSDEFISLENQSAGVYYIVVTDQDTLIGRYKLILK